MFKSQQQQQYMYPQQTQHYQQYMQNAQQLKSQSSFRNMPMVDDNDEDDVFSWLIGGGVTTKGYGNSNTMQLEYLSSSTNPQQSNSLHSTSSTHSMFSNTNAQSTSSDVDETLMNSDAYNNSNNNNNNSSNSSIGNANDDDVQFTWADVLFDDTGIIDQYVDQHDKDNDFDPAMELLNMAETPRIGLKQVSRLNSLQHAEKGVPISSSTATAVAAAAAASNSHGLRKSSLDSIAFAIEQTGHGLFGPLTPQSPAFQHTSNIVSTPVPIYQHSSPEKIPQRPFEDEKSLKSSSTTKRRKNSTISHPDSDQGSGSGKDQKPHFEDDSGLSPRSLAQRERNREAVRNCRKRKREYEVELREKYTRVQEENLWLKNQLKFRSNEIHQRTELEEQEILRFLDACLNLSNESVVVANNKSLESVVEATQSYLENTANSSKERVAAIDFLLSRLSRDMLPVATTKLMLWQASQDPSYFSNHGGMWEDMCKNLELTQDQIQRICQLCIPKLSQTRVDLEKTFVDLKRLRDLLLDEKKLTFEYELLLVLSKELTSIQFARFLSTLNKLATNHLDWKSFIGEIFDTSSSTLMSPTSNSVSISTNSGVSDDEISKSIRPPRVNTPTFSDLLSTSSNKNATYTPRNPASSPPLTAQSTSSQYMNYKPADSRQQLEQLRIANIDLLSELFTTNSNNVEELTEIAKQVVTEDISVLDPNTIGQSRGIGSLVTLMRRIKLAFASLTITVVERTVNGDKARVKWLCKGSYAGRLKPIVSNTAPSLSFELVISLLFQKNSTLVEEIVMSWDSVSLMVQLGLLDESVISLRKQRNQTAGIIPRSVLPAETPIPKELSIEEVNSIRERAFDDLRQMFEAGDESLIAYLARRSLTLNCVFLDSNMVSEFKGQSQCIKYIHRVRRPFPKFAVQQQTIVRDNVSSYQVEKYPFALRPLIEATWVCASTYGGTLAKKPCPCVFQANLQILFSKKTNQIELVRFAWDARSLLSSLGVINEQPITAAPTAPGSSRPLNAVPALHQMKMSTMSPPPPPMHSNSLMARHVRPRPDLPSSKMI